MSADADLMRILVPACAAESDATLDTLIGIAVTRMDASTWGTYLQQGACLLAGHIYLRGKATTTRNGAGAVTSESAGGMSIGYGSVMGNIGDADLLTTGPGVDFVGLRRQLGVNAAMLTLPIDQRI